MIRRATMQKITPHLWFDNQAEDAANFYVSVFSGSASGGKDSKVISVSRYGEAGKEVHGQEAGTAMTVEFELVGQRFLALNAGPLFKFNESISFVVDCENQEEVDYYWEKLSAVPESEQCGWLKDTYGLSWQIVPKQLSELMNSTDSAAAGRVMEALLKMKKLDIAGLEAAANKA
jgi:predicted 3-demethylubiquinone-9 3-methyltransferase (glyoxalase superfamily)